MADYAAVDQAGKLNVIGGGISVLTRVPNAEQTAPVALVVSLAAPPDRYGDECMVEITLEDASGDIVTLPGAVPGVPQPLRINQSAKFTEPTAQHPLITPKGYLWAGVQLVVQFPVGLPLRGIGGYQWRVKIDDQARDDWTEKFVVTEQAVQ
jgi:hypothetical protein